jgi:hypothetical protein
MTDEDSSAGVKNHRCRVQPLLRPAHRLREPNGAFGLAAWLPDREVEPDPGHTRAPMDLTERIVAAVAPHPAVRSIRLVGSRADGRASERCDWTSASKPTTAPPLQMRSLVSDVERRSEGRSAVRFDVEETFAGGDAREHESFDRYGSLRRGQGTR